MTSSRPNEPLWPRAGRSGRSEATRSSSRRVAPSGNGVSPGDEAGVWSVLRRLNPTGPRSGMRWLRCIRLGDGCECRGRFGIGHAPKPLDPGEDPSLPIIESLLDVGWEDEPAAGGPDPERDGDGVFGFMSDRDGDPLHAELFCACRRTAVKADGRLTGREALDFDVAPADPTDAEAEHLRDGLLG